MFFGLAKSLVDWLLDRSTDCFDERWDTFQRVVRRRRGSWKRWLAPWGKSEEVDGVSLFWGNLEEV